MPKFSSPAAAGLAAAAVVKPVVRERVFGPLTTPTAKIARRRATRGPVLEPRRGDRRQPGVKPPIEDRRAEPLDR